MEQKRMKSANDSVDRDSLDAGRCVHCGICTKNCSFLSKYNMDIGDTQELERLAYHCFLCGRCSETCPVGIDGRGVVLEIRKQQAAKMGKLPEKGYGMLLLEKKNYLFRNYRHINITDKKEKSNVQIKEDSEKGKSVFFPGCNFPSFYPETTKKLIKVLEEKGIGVVFDCCGKPIAELGLKGQEEAIVSGMERRLKEAGIEELVMACPNCYSFLKPKLQGISVISIYEKLSDFGIGKEIEEDISVFLPCPDRNEKKLLGKISSFIAGEITIISEAACCGLGGCGAVKEPELSRGMAEKLLKAGYETIYTYCGSCAGNLSRNGCREVVHVLTEIMETGEKPDTSGSLFNRIKTKFW